MFDSILLDLGVFLQCLLPADLVVQLVVLTPEERVAVLRRLDGFLQLAV